MLRFMTFNIRFDNPADGQDVWANRKEAVANEILSIAPVIIGIQEALIHQINDLVSMLNEKEDKWLWIGVGRAGHSGNGNEYNPIIYNKHQVHQINWGTYWLSDSPHTPGSKFSNLNATLPRIVTWGEFRVKYSDNEKNLKPFFFFNTHFSHNNSYERQLSASLILQMVSNTAYLYPSILLGDFNCEADSEEYKTIADSYFDDARIVSNKVYNSHLHTFTGFTSNVQQNVGILTIDHIFVSGFKVETYEIVNHSRSCGRCISDHRAIFIDANISV